MGRPPSNGGPSFRFNPTEVAEMESILQAHNCLVPQREVLTALAEKFSNSAERSGKPAVQMKQVWNWFQNRRYALRAKSAKPPAKLNVSPMPQHDLATGRNVPQAPQHPSVPAANVRNVPQVPQPVPTPTVQSAGRNGSDNSQMEFEAKSARDGAWYDVATFLSHRSMETSDPEVLVRFAGFGPEEDEWVNVRKHVRQRSLPCESSECVAVLPGDLILCFQEGKEQALYFDAHVLDAQRRRHDVRGCRCRFLVRYDHDQSEEIVPLRKVCRRPETDYRMQQLHAESANMKQNRTVFEPHTGSNVKAYPPGEATLKQPKVEGPAETIPTLAKSELHADSGPLPAPVSHANIPITTSVAPAAHSSEPLASATASSPHSNVSVAPTLAPDTNSGVPGATILSPVASSVPVAPTAAPVANSSVHGATMVAPVASSVPAGPIVTPVANSSVPGTTIVAPTASNVHVAQAVAPVADSSVPTVSTTAPAAKSSVPVSPTVAPVANSSVPIVPTTAPAANSSVPIAPTAAPTANSSVPIASAAEAPVANSSVPIDSTAEAPVANSSVPVATTAEVPVATNSGVPIAPAATPTANSSVPIAPTSEDPVANSSVPVATIAEAPVATNSSVHGATTEAPVASNVSPLTEFKVLPEKVSECGPADNVDNTNAQSANLAVAGGTDTSVVSEEGPGESMQLG